MNHTIKPGGYVIQHAFHVFFGAGNLHFDSPICIIAHPPDYTILTRFLLYFKTKTGTLHMTTDNYMFSHFIPPNFYYHEPIPYLPVIASCETRKIVSHTTC